MAGVTLEELVVLLADALKPLADAGAQGQPLRIPAGLYKGLDVVCPCEDVLFRRVVRQEDFVIVVFGRVIGVDDRNGDAGLFGHEIAHGLRRIGRKGGAQEAG